MKTILISAYAVNPYKGSEDGMGWNFICQAARFNKVIAVTRKNNAIPIEKYKRENPDACFDHIRFLYYDLPYWMRFWKRGSRGALLYFYLWQMNLPGFIRKSSCDFDIAHNLNFHNDWTPSWLWKTGKPLVWGPVGHHPVIPREFIHGFYGTGAYFTDTLRWITKRFLWACDPFLKTTYRKASVILCMNKSVQSVLPFDKNKMVIMPSVGSEFQPEGLKRSHGNFHVLSVGRFVPLKGFDVAIKSFAGFYNKLEADQKAKAKLTLIGKGPYRNALMELAKRERVDHAVHFINWVDREQLTGYYREASVFLFPSHEGAGMVVSEALSFGLPVICFNNCGPGEFIDETCGIKIPYENYDQSVRKFSKSLFELYSNHALRDKLGDGAIYRFRNYFSWDAKGEMLKRVYESVSENDHKEKQPVVCVHLLNDYSGSPLILSEAIKGLVRSGHQVDLYTCGRSKGFLSGLPVKNYFFWYRFYSNKYLRLLAFILSQGILFFSLLKYLRKPVTIYVNTLLPFGAALAGKLMGKKVVFHLHETSINPPALKNFLKRIAESTANTAIYVSQFLRKKEPLRGVLSSVIYNALPDEFVNKASAFRLHKVNNIHTFNVLMICSLKKYKGVFDFIELAERMSHIHFELVINSSAEAIRLFLKGRQIPSNLLIHAATPDVHSFYERANLVLNLSHPDQWVETFGMTILEAMCYGIPVIAPPVGGVTELVQSNINGYLKDVRSKFDLQNTIHQIYNDPGLCKRLSEQALLTAGKFSASNLHQRICEVIEKPVGR